MTEQTGCITQVRISLVIPHMPSIVTDAALDRCIKSFEEQYDELIVIVNDGMGYGPAVNLGLKYATGDYIVVSNNDIECLEGSLRNIVWSQGFSIPTIEPEPRDYLPRSIFCMSKWHYQRILAKDGFFYDPRFETGYFEDDDLIARTQDFAVRHSEGAKVNHLNGGGMTMKCMGEQRYFDKNQKVFNEKWSG